MNKSLTLPLCALVLSVTGCASAGNQVLAKQDAATVSQSIVDGKSTKADVQTAYGDPNDTSFTDGGNEIWKYTYAYATPTAASFVPVVGIFAGGANVDKKTLVILFDKSGVVVKHTMSSSHEQVKRGS
jgi:outer membrane protein assembly factor BamE (lipoprotein component of BamABCDE complex)